MLFKVVDWHRNGPYHQEGAKSPSATVIAERISVTFLRFLEEEVNCSVRFSGYACLNSSDLIQAFNDRSRLWNHLIFDHIRS
jgi:hypothetical protein